MSTVSRFAPLGTEPASAYPHPVGMYDNPLEWLQRFTLPSSVYSCEEAAAAKAVTLDRELKSLLLECDGGLVLAHVRGDHQLSLRAVKKLLATKQASLARPEVLASLGIVAGTLTPFRPEVWGLSQLVTKEILLMPWITTNAGSDSHFIVFDPQLLLRSPRLLLGDIEA